MMHLLSVVRPRTLADKVTTEGYRGERASKGDAEPETGQEPGAEPPSVLTVTISWHPPVLRRALLGCQRAPGKCPQGLLLLVLPFNTRLCSQFQLRVSPGLGGSDTLGGGSWTLCVMLRTDPSPPKFQTQETPCLLSFRTEMNASGK